MGSNDAPALSIASMSGAMGSGTDIAIRSVASCSRKMICWRCARLWHESKDLQIGSYSISSEPLSTISWDSNCCWSLVGLGLIQFRTGLAMALSSVSVLTSSLLLNVANWLMEMKWYRILYHSFSLFLFPRTTRKRDGYKTIVKYPIVGQFVKFLKEDLLWNRDWKASGQIIYVESLCDKLIL